MDDVKKKRVFITAAVIGLVMGVGGVLIALATDDKPKVAASGAELSAQEGMTPGVPTSTTAAPAAPTTTAPVVNAVVNPDGTLSTVAPRPKEPEPKQITVRSPQRCANTGAPTTGTVPGDSANGAKKWVTVSEISGSCDLQGSNFTLRGIDTRLVFRSDAANFNAFVVDTKTGIEGTAGFPHAQCPGPCADSEMLSDPKNQYYLRVQADGGPWQLLIQEYR